MRCAMFGCSVNNKKNNNGAISFHTFPKDQKICKQWVFLCHRKDKLNTNTARICSKHFKESDFVPLNPIYEQYGLLTKIRRLKENTVPSLLLPFQKQDKNLSSLCLRLQNRLARPSDPLALSADDLNIKTEDDLCAVAENTDTELELQMLPDSFIVSTSVGSTQTETFRDDCSTQTAETFKADRGTQTNVSTYSDSKLKKEILKLKAQCAKQKTIIDSIGHIFTKAQIKKFEGSGKRVKWAAEDIANAIKLHAAGPRAYRLLLRKNYPLPAVITLKKWRAKVQVYNKTLSSLEEVSGVTEG